MFPAADLPVPAQQRVQAVLETAHRALGLRNGITHTEFRVGDAGVCLMELNARIPGGHITDLVELVTGIDLVEAAARTACGALSGAELSAADLAGPRAVGPPAYAAAVHRSAPGHCLGARFAAVRAGTEVICSRDA